MTDLTNLSTCRILRQSVASNFEADNDVRNVQILLALKDMITMINAST